MENEQNDGTTFHINSARTTDQIVAEAIHYLKTAIDAVPKLGAVTTFLLADRRAIDAVAACHAAGYPLWRLVISVARVPKFDEATADRLLGHFVAKEFSSIVTQTVREQC